MAFATDEDIWDEFLAAWPLDRLRTMTLEEYSQSGSKGTFTYWMEVRLDMYGSIWGGSAFKFAIYSRTDKEPKEGDSALAYTADYAWYRRFGDTPQTAFETIRAQVVAVAEAAHHGKLEDIDKSELGPTYRWKIAFHYQDRSHPRVTCVFSREPLLSFLGMPLNDKSTPMYQLQQGTMARRPADEPVTSFGEDVWRQWVTSHPLQIKLTKGAINNGYLSFSLSQSPFPEVMYGDLSGKAPGETARFRTDRGEIFETDIRRSGSAGRLRHRLGRYFKDTGLVEGDVIEVSAEDDGSYVITHLPQDQAQATKPTSTPTSREVREHTTEHTVKPVNRILFGPPGTGKTFRTVNEAIAILDPDFLTGHATDADRPALKQRFDALVAANRIRFVTFHQSFSYEDFVEGIRAATDEDTGSLRYDVEDGIFKQVCEAASSRAVSESGDSVDLTGRRIWKMSLGEAVSEANIYDECIEENRILLGFGSDLDFAGIGSRKDIVQRLRDAGEDTKPADFAVRAIYLLVRKMKVGDLVVVSEGNLKFRAIGEVTGEYRHIERDGDDTYSQCRPVRWLRRYDPAQPYTAVMTNRFSQRSIYELRPGSIDMEKLAGLLAPEPIRGKGADDYVLIIDEINRGNISRIFGELITLIEPSKRAGAREALEVVLPYSKELFSVPSNVHLIGTMNTADRSLAGLDVALRRRFEFIEVLPDPTALAGVVVEGVSIADLLTLINKRIEVLMGRDYMLGHAYFLGLKAEPTIEALATVFRDKILPLLQEYFYEDWQKIAWVLNDHRKPEDLRFVRQVDTGTKALFGEGVELPNEARLWQINDAAFVEPAAYQAIISVSQASA